MKLKLVTSVAPYVTSANAFEAIRLAHYDGFSGIELNEDHLHCLVQSRPDCLRLMREYGNDNRMTNFLHKTLHRPSIDSEVQTERGRAIRYTLKTLDYMESAGISRMVLHSFSDLPAFFSLKSLHANGMGYALGRHAVKFYGVMAPVLKAYRTVIKEKIEQNFMHSLVEIAKYAADKRANGEPIDIVFEEHYSDAIDYENIAYGRGNLINVIRGIDTAHQLIRTGENTDLSRVSGPIHFHAVDTNGIIDDHRTIGTGKVDFKDSLSCMVERHLSNVIVLEDGMRGSALKSKNALTSMINRISVVNL